MFCSIGPETSTIFIPVLKLLIEFKPDTSVAIDLCAAKISTDLGLYRKTVKKDKAQ